MDEQQHTPGPWRITRCGDHEQHPAYIVNGAGFATGYICHIPPRHESAEANARLIAAAPELYRACALEEAWSELAEELDVQERRPQRNAGELERLMREMDRVRDEATTLRRAALAKANGEEVSLG